MYVLFLLSVSLVDDFSADVLSDELTKWLEETIEAQGEATEAQRQRMKEEFTSFCRNQNLRTKIGFWSNDVPESLRWMKGGSEEENVTKKSKKTMDVGQILKLAAKQQYVLQPAPRKLEGLPDREIADILNRLTDARNATYKLEGKSFRCCEVGFSLVGVFKLTFKQVSEFLKSVVDSEIEVFFRVISDAVSNGVNVPCLREGHKLFEEMTKKAELATALKFSNWGKQKSLCLQYLDEVVGSAHYNWELPPLLTELVIRKHLKLNVQCYHCNDNSLEFSHEFGSKDDRIVYVTRVREAFLHLVEEGKADNLPGLNLEKEAKARSFYRKDVPDLMQWEYWFGQMESVGIPNIINRYKEEYVVDLPVLERAGTGRGRTEVCWYESQNEDGLWEQFDISAPKEPVIVHIIKGRKPALLFRDYLTRIGGDNALSESLGDTYRAIELFNVGHGDESDWRPLCWCREFPEIALKNFLLADLNALKCEILDNFIGQKNAKSALMYKVVAESMFAQETDRRFRVNDYNMVFLGEPGTGKTTLAQITGRLLFFCGLVRVGHVVQRTGAEVGQATGNADQTSLFVKRLYQRARDGVLFIDELYGITPRTDMGIAGTANQIAAIAAITDLSLNQPCCTIAAGYKHEVEACFFARNEGLRRRFKEVPFVQYIDWELYTIFRKSAIQKMFVFTPTAERVLLYLFAGFSAPARNGAFCDDMVRNLHGQLARRKVATGGDREFDSHVHEQDLIFIWSLMTDGSREYDEQLEEISKCLKLDQLPSEMLMKEYAEAKPKVVIDAKVEGLWEFIKACCETGIWFSVLSAPLYNAYKKWAGPLRLTPSEFKTHLSQRHEWKHVKAGNIYMQIKLLPQYDQRKNEEEEDE